MSSSLINTYNRLPVRFTHGDGVWLYDDQGNRYLDALSGIAVCGLGHAHPRITAAISEQAGRLLHTSNLYEIPLQEELGQRLLQLSGMQGAFLCNSGAEANEAMIKLARLHGHRMGFDEPSVITMQGSFHGRTLATLSATGNPKVHKGFAPLVGGFVHAPFAEIDSVRQLAERDNQISAVMVEAILGEGGVVVPPVGYLQALREVCDAHGWLLMMDEIQTGIGRTGCWFAHQHENIHPDVMSLAKALGNGLPIGACLVADKAVDLFTPGSHGTTFGGNPLACSAALAVLDCMQEENLPERAGQRGQQLIDELNTGLTGLNCVQEIRGKGLMLAVQMEHPCAELVAMALKRGLLINVTADRVVRLLPPLIIDAEQTSMLAEALCKLIRDWNAGIKD